MQCNKSSKEFGLYSAAILAVAEFLAVLRINKPLSVSRYYADFPQASHGSARR
jgi:hypothetical protein